MLINADQPEECRVVILEDGTQIVEEAYLGILSRMPTAEELKIASEHIAARTDDRRGAVLEIVWSLIASAEFRLNH